MASLVGNAINASCGGLLKTTDNAVIGATEKRVTDGLGNATNMTIGTGGTSFDSGTVDFTGATVSGLPSAAGLVNGTGTDSLISAASLTTTAATSGGDTSIALGNGAIVNNFATDGISLGNTSCVQSPDGVAIGASAWSRNGGVALGKNSTSYDTNDVAIGEGACSNAGNAVALGAGVTGTKNNTVTVKELETCVAGGGIYLTTPDGLAQPKLTVNNSSELLIGGNPVGGAAGLESGTGASSMQSAASLTTTAANASGCNSITLGENARDTSNSTDVNGSIILGYNANTNFSQSIVIGQDACATILGGIAIGLQAKACANNFAMALGRTAIASGYMSTAIGAGAQATAGGFGSGSTAIGNNACATAICSVALGTGVVASKISTVTVKELETCVAGGGIYLTTPDGLAQPKLTVNNSSELLIGGNPVGGGAAGLVSGTGTDSMQSDASLTTLAASASGACGIALGDNALAAGACSIAIGRNTNTGTGTDGVVIGTSACGFGSGSVAIGFESCANSAFNVALGRRAKTAQSSAVVIGNTSAVDTSGGIAIGSQSCVASTSPTGVAIGCLARANATNSVALGRSIIAAKADTVTVCQLETCGVGLGITMKSPNGTEYVLTVSDAGALVIT